MVGGKLAELFIDINLRGGGKVALISMRDQLKAYDKSLENNASLYNRQADAKIALTDRMAEKQAKLLDLDEKFYRSKKYGRMLNAQAETNFRQATNESLKGGLTEQAAHANFLSNFGTRRQHETVLRDIQKDRNAKQREELMQLQRTTLERGKATAIMQLLKNRMATGNTAAIGGIGTGGAGFAMAARAAGAIGGPIGMAVTAAVAGTAAAISGAIYAGIQLARSASPNANATYEGSWKMLTNEIGMVLIPGLMRFSKFLQDAALAVQRFKESQIAKGTAAGANMAASGVGAVFRGIGNVLFGGNGLKLGSGEGGMYTSSSHQAQFRSFEDGWRQVQMEVASGGSIESKLLEQAMRGNQIAAASAANLAIIANQPPPGNL